MATTLQLYDTTQYLINKYDGSFLSTDEFLQAYNLASNDYYNFLIDSAYAVMTRTNTFSTPTNSDNQVIETLSPFTIFEQAISSPYSKPTDFGRVIYIKSAFTGDVQTTAPFATRIDLVELDNKLNSSIDPPVAADPIYVEVSGKFLIYPTTPINVWITYYKKPIKQTGVDSTVVEWADNKVNNVLFRVLGYLGINLKDPGLIQFGNIKKVDA
jgi:hypothetical protein